jgi:hypothetical protein
MVEDKDKPEPSPPPRVPDRRAGGAASRGARDGTPLDLAGRVLRSRWRARTARLARDIIGRTQRIGNTAPH